MVSAFFLASFALTFAAVVLTRRDLLRSVRALSDERFRSFLESAPDAVVIVNREARIMLVNAQTEVLFGYARSELVGQLVHVLVAERFRAAHVGHVAGYFREPRVRVMGQGAELFASRKDGSEFAVEISLAPVPTPGGMITMATIRDVTTRKRVEEMRRDQARLSAQVERAAKLVDSDWQETARSAGWKAP